MMIAEVGHAVVSRRDRVPGRRKYKTGHQVESCQRNEMTLPRRKHRVMGHQVRKIARSRVVVRARRERRVLVQVLHVAVITRNVAQVVRVVGVVNDVVEAVVAVAAVIVVPKGSKLVKARDAKRVQVLLEVEVGIRVDLR
jgi:hypothetical protein